MSAAVPFWRFLPDCPAPDLRSLHEARVAGRGPFARALREARHALGAHRAASLLREGEALPEMPFRLVVAAAFQPRAIADALDVSFAIAGLSLELRTLDGFAALGIALADPQDASFADTDMLLIASMPGAEGPPEGLDALVRSARERCRAPVVLASVVADAKRSDVEDPDHLVVRVRGPVADKRFAATFGTIPTTEAADRLADAVAARAARLRGLAPKLVVTDLDGTLWRGTLGETGLDTLNAAYAEVLANLAKRGVVLALASRNDPADVEAAFAAHPQWPLARDAFSAAAIGWQPKDALVAAVLERLALGSEHMIFVDDDPANCAAVAARFPDADVRHPGGDPDAFAACLADDPLLREAGGGGEDRRELYRRRDAVERLRAETPDIGAFLRALDTRLTALPLGPALVPRAAELAIRVNQFAMNDWRPNVETLAERASPLDFMVRLDDAFGAHGLVGLVLGHVEGRDAVVESFFLSCRALGRGIETAMLRALAGRAAELGCDRLAGRIGHLPRNEPARRSFSPYIGDAADTWTVRLDAHPFEAPEGVTWRWETTTS